MRLTDENVRRQLQDKVVLGEGDVNVVWEKTRDCLWMDKRSTKAC